MPALPTLEDLAAANQQLPPVPYNPAGQMYPVQQPMQGPPQPPPPQPDAAALEPVRGQYQPAARHQPVVADQPPMASPGAPGDDYGAAGLEPVRPSQRGLAVTEPGVPAALDTGTGPIAIVEAIKSGAQALRDFSRSRTGYTQPTEEPFKTEVPKDFKPGEQEPGTPDEAIPIPGRKPPPAAGPPQVTQPAETPPAEKPRGARPDRQALPVQHRSQYPEVNDKPQYDPTSYATIQQTNPELAHMIDYAAQATNTDRLVLANWIMATSKGDPNFSDPKRGVGLMGITPDDIAHFDPQGKTVTNPFDPMQNLMIGAARMDEANQLYTKNSAASLVAQRFGYTGANALARLAPGEQRKYGEEELAWIKQVQDPTNARAVPASAAGTSVDDHPVINAPSTMTPKGLVEAGSTGNPQNWMTYMTHNASHGANVTDMWRQAEISLVGAFIAKGDMVGAQHAQDFVFQQSHAGANMALMDAYRYLRQGDNIGAARMLAKAYTFAPDGGAMMVQATKDGGVWAQRFNEDTHQKIGNPFPIDAGRIVDMMQETKDPMKFKQLLMEQQKSQADIAHKYYQDFYHMGLPGQRQAQTEFVQSAETARTVFTQNQIAARAAQRAAAGGAERGALSEAAIQAEVSKAVPLQDAAGQPIRMTPEMGNKAATLSDILHTSRGTGLPTQDAVSITEDLMRGPTASVYEVGADPKTGLGVIFDRRHGLPVAYLSPYGVARLKAAFPPTQQQQGQRPTPPPTPPRMPQQIPTAPAPFGGVVAPQATAMPS